MRGCISAVFRSSPRLDRNHHKDSQGEVGACFGHSQPHSVVAAAKPCEGRSAPAVRSRLGSLAGDQRLPSTTCRIRPDAFCEQPRPAGSLSARMSSRNSMVRQPHPAPRSEVEAQVVVVGPAFRLGTCAWLDHDWLQPSCGAAPTSMARGQGRLEVS